MPNFRNAFKEVKPFPMNATISSSLLMIFCIDVLEKYGLVKYRIKVMFKSYWTRN
jgi:hypothetical protein